MATVTWFLMFIVSSGDDIKVLMAQMQSFWRPADLLETMTSKKVD